MSTTEESPRGDLDIAPENARTARRKPRSLLDAWPALLALCLAMLVEMVDNTVMQIALPTIARDLHAGTTDLQWVTAAYSLTFGGLLLVGGTVGDLFGRKKGLMFGLTGFGLVSLLVPFVSAPWHLIAVRAGLGVFAAFMAPGTMSLIFRLFDDEKLRARAIGVVMSVAMAGFAVGPILSGLAVEHLSWHVLLVVNAPVAVIALVGVWFGIDADDPAERRGTRLDVPGALLSMTTLASGLYAFTAGVERGWTSPVTLGCFTLAAVAAVGFVARERTASDPMLDIDLLMRPIVRGSAIVQISVMLSMVGAMYGLTQQFQFAWGWSPLEAGFANIPFVVAMFAASPFADRLIAHYGQRRTSIIGGALAVAGLVILAFAVSTSYPFIAAGIVVLVFGVRATMTSSALGLMGDLPDTHTSVGAALNDTSQELGNSIGVAVMGTVMAVIVGNHLPQGAWPASLSADFVRAEQIALAIIAVLVTAFVAVGARTLTDSTQTDEHAEAH